LGEKCVAGLYYFDCLFVAVDGAYVVMDVVGVELVLGDHEARLVGFEEVVGGDAVVFVVDLVVLGVVVVVYYGYRVD